MRAFHNARRYRYADAASLTHIRKRLERVRRDQDEAHARLLDAQRAVEVLSRESQELESAEQAISVSLAGARTALFQDSASRVPDDIWRCIFEDSAAPFVSASVCTRWRQIALSSSHLWSRITLASTGAHPPDAQLVILANQLGRLDLMLSRSRTSPLQLTIAWSNGDGQALELMRDILIDAALHAPRWEHASLSFPSGVSRDVFDALQGATPLLTSLEITVTGAQRWSENPELGHLPFAPRLNSLRLRGTAIGCFSYSQLPHLTHAHLASCGIQEKLYVVTLLLFRAGKSLETLVIDAWPDIGVLAAFVPADRVPPRGPVVLPKLRSLEVLNNSRSSALEWTATTLLTVPSLTHITLGRDAIQPTLAPFLDDISATVTHLALYDALTTAHLDILSRLQNVERLSLVTDAQIDRPALARLASRTAPPIWRRLTSITIPAKGLSSEAILSFVRFRGRAPTDAPPAAAPTRCRLREVSFGPDAPTWLIAEVKRLLTL
ncbi:hypothetical protein AURDEDRAFT_175317 [Auricularia subglabra TFB-10046 SS5]|nr:hypothetical protein AURDEDRAFT_175317 [Auricularia subglabra TFB-10046 SS5]